MSDIAVRVENISKKYQLGGIGAGSIRETVANVFSRNGKEEEADKVFWALKDISFDVKKGEVVGIIGRNGAGKSTLLKVLSKITEPTSGRILLNGRIASLLEVGTGFHPELSGRENIFLNGSILGMTRAEIKQKFDEIVDFSGVEKFLNTPVKRYSSGMYVRLAFSVAAHLEPEILVIDEVLAVGDAEFQKKCLGKMRDVASEGRTVLFVSHNMGAIQELTSRCLLLNHGEVIKDANSNIAVEAYYQNQRQTYSTASFLKTNIPGLEVKWLNQDLKADYQHKLKVPFRIRLEKPIPHLSIGIQFFNSARFRITTSKSDLEYLTPGEHEIEVEMDLLNLAPGSYSVTTWFRGLDTGHLFDSVASLDISDVNVSDTFLASRRDYLGVYLPTQVHTSSAISSQSKV